MRRSFTFIIIGIFLLVNVITTDAYAQNKLSAGFNVGTGVSSLHDNGYGANKLHIHFGVPLNYKINKNFEIQTTALISSKGYTSSIYKPSERMSFYYLDLVTTLKYIPWKIFFIGSGLYTSGLMYSHYKYLAYSYDYYGEPDVSGIVNKFDYGLNGSFGCQYENGIGFEVSILYGLRDVFNSHISDTLDGYYGAPHIIPAEANGNNVVISTSFYYLFGY